MEPEEEPNVAAVREVCEEVRTRGERGLLELRCSASDGALGAFSALRLVFTRWREIQGHRR